MRLPRDFRRGQLYGVTQRGNNGQWVYVDDEDFRKAMDLMRKYAQRHEVLIHGWSLLNSHGHWIFEASGEESISNLMRDMQSQHSRYLNLKYKTRPWMLLGYLGDGKPPGFSLFWKAGPVNWAPRFDADPLDAESFRSFLRYIELNPVQVKMRKRAEDWPWSSASAHLTGTDHEGLLCLDRWRDAFGQPAAIVEQWRAYMHAPLKEERAKALQARVWSTGSAHNRVKGWVRPAMVVAAASSGVKPG